MHIDPARICLIGLLAALPARAETKIARVHCEYAVNPLGIDTPQPRLGWVLESTERNVLQSAYQVLAASSEQLLQQERGDLWDSGKVSGDDSIHVTYAGKPLQSGQRVYWKARVWDNHDQPSPWSEPAWWEMALLQSKDWQGKWICSDQPLPAQDEDFYVDHPAPLFRKEFTASKQIARARAYVSGLGYYELYLNGRRVGDHVLDPGWTTYSQRVLYSTYDVTALLLEGPNAVGAIVGNGWYNPLPLRLWGSLNLRRHLTIGKPRVILQLNLEYADGSRESIVTDETWKTSDSPILRNSVYLGEIYDARKEQPGWNATRFDDSTWRPVELSNEPLGPLQAQSAPPIRITRTLKPVALTEPQPGVYIFDLGQNFAGWVRLKVAGPAGTTVKLRYGELLHPNGTLNPLTSVCGQIKAKGVGGPGAPDIAWQCDTYILKGDDEETYTPRFTFHGFRYVELTGLPARPPLDAIEGLRLNADVRQVGTFECSDPLFNRIHEMVQWTFLSNLFSVQSDCPHREKFGYGGDIVASSEAFLFNYDMARFYAKAARDLHDATRPNGGLTETAPFVGIADEGFGEGTGPIEWGLAHPWLLRVLYRYCGDERLSAEQYDTARQWLEFLQARAQDHLIAAGLSDHESLVPKPTAITGAGFYFLTARLTSYLAASIGKGEDSQRYARLHADIGAALNAKYLRDDGAYPVDGKISQCAQALPLYLGIVPKEAQEHAIAVLVNDIAEHDHHLTTGIFGTKFVLNVLSDYGHVDLAYALVGQKTFPGWGHMLERGATTLWEHWEFSDNTYSHNHPMFGSVDDWFYKVVAGIIPGSAGGWQTFTVNPHPGGGLTWARAEHDSIRGKIRSEWRQDGRVFMLKVAVPVNSTAIVTLPAPPGAVLTESGRPVAADTPVPGILRLGTVESGSISLEIGSGEYQFRVNP